MVIHWGPQRVALYNDAFGVLLGGKHPAALGRPARDTWPEAWDIIGGRLDEVMVHGRTMHAKDEERVLHRNGYPEECYFSYSLTAGQNTNSKLRDIAARVVDTGALPFRPTMIDDLILRVAKT